MNQNMNELLMSTIIFYQGEILYVLSNTMFQKLQKSSV